MKHSVAPSARSPVRRAFTMLEVLVVIVILAILMALITNVVKRLQVQSQIENTKATLNLLMTGIERYYDEQKFYPSSPYDMMQLPSCKELLSAAEIPGTAKPTDGFGHEIVYSPTEGPGGRPKLTSNGPDGLAGTKDDITLP